MFLQTARQHASLLVVLLVVTALSVGVTASAFGNTAATPDDAEPNDDRASATELQDGDEVNGSLDAGGDVDWYAVETTAGHGLIANLTLTSHSSNQSVRVDLYDPDGNQIGAIPRDRLSGPSNQAGYYEPMSVYRDFTARVADVAEANATYYVRVARTEWDDESGDVTYALGVNTVTLDGHDPNEDGATATQVTPGETAEAVFAPYDSDVYAVTVPAGTNVTVTVVADARLEKALFVSDTAATIDDDTYDGEYLLVKDPFSFRAVVTFTAEEGGTYYVQLVQGDTNTRLVTQEPYSLTVETSTDDGDGSDGGDGTDRPKDGGDCPT